MKKIDIIKVWLENRQRSFAGGLAIFTEFASDAVKSKCEKYFAEVVDEPNQFDPHFTILVAKVSDIYRNITIAPGNYPAAFDEIIKEVETGNSAELNEKLTALTAELKAVQLERDELESKCEELEEDGEDHESEIEELGSKIEEKDTRINELESEIVKLQSESGLKIVSEKDLPQGILKFYDRIKIITPLIAHLHAQLTTASTDEDRKTSAEELCKLDDERRKLWDKIDDWSVGKNVKLEEPKAEYSSDQLVRGQQIHIRLSQLKLNIERTKKSIDQFVQEGKKNKEINATSRLEAYQKEFDELNAELNANK